MTIQMTDNNADNDAATQKMGNDADDNNAAAELDATMQMTR
jgi:hypothetical protein